MKVIRRDQVTPEDSTDRPIFFGGKVYAQRLVARDASQYYNFGIVSFAAGARNKLHTHTCDQILYVTKGKGIVATEREEVVVTEGDTVLIPQGEKHWHGATPDSEFDHISLLTADSKTDIVG